MNRRENNGFTLVELLVVIAIIGILAAIALVSFTQSQRQARDTQRKSDLKQYQTVLENYANNHDGFFPAHINSSGKATELCSEVLEMSNCPEDPSYDATSNQEQYYYYQTPDGSATSDWTPTAAKYILWALLESEADKYWVVCSTGTSGVSSSPPSGGSCPAL